MAWATSSRRAELPRNWASIRAAILRRDPTCRLGYDCCTTTSTEVDHVDSRHDHTRANLRGVCGPCHTRRTQAQAQAAARLKGRRRPDTEPHPGRLA